MILTCLGNLHIISEGLEHGLGVPGEGNTGLHWWRIFIHELTGGASQLHFKSVAGDKWTGLVWTTNLLDGDKNIVQGQRK